MSTAIYATTNVSDQQDIEDKKEEIHIKRRPPTPSISIYPNDFSQIVIKAFDDDFGDQTIIVDVRDVDLLISKLKEERSWIRSHM
jgi:hypothetical protein